MDRSVDHEKLRGQDLKPLNRDPDGHQTGKSALIALAGILATISGGIIGYTGLFESGHFKSTLISLLILVAASFLVIWFYGDLGNSKEFRSVIISVLTVAVAGLGVYIIYAPENLSQSRTHSTGNPSTSSLPRVSFNSQQSSAPWCSTFKLTTTGPIPHGYQLVIFATGAAANWTASEGYEWIGSATPIEGQSNQWITPAVYMGPPYEGPPSEHIVSAGFREIVAAEILTDQAANIYRTIQAPKAATGAPSFNFSKLPSSVPEDELQVTRNSELVCQP